MSPVFDFFAGAAPGAAVFAAPPAAGRAAGSGVVGATVETCSVGVSDVTGPLGRGRGAARAPLVAETGCSGHTAVARSSIVGNRWSGSFAIAREIASERNGGTFCRMLLVRGASSKICL